MTRDEFIKELELRVRSLSTCFMPEITAYKAGALWAYDKLQGEIDRLDKKSRDHLLETITLFDHKKELRSQPQAHKAMIRELVDGLNKTLPVVDEAYYDHSSAGHIPGSGYNHRCYSRLPFSWRQTREYSNWSEGLKQSLTKAQSFLESSDKEQAE